MRYEVDRTRREVRTTFAGAFAATAIYRAGYGCLLLRVARPPDPPVPEAPAPAASPPLLPDIAGPGLVEPANDKLRVALDRAFAEPDRPLYRWTKAVVVVKDGKVVAERYAPGVGIDTPLPGRSITKSVTSALIGILVREGKLTVDMPAPVAAWQHADDPRRAITIDALLRMKSGLALEERAPASIPIRACSLSRPTSRASPKARRSKFRSAAPGTT